MAKKGKGAPESVPFTIRLPEQTTAMLDQLRDVGLYGSSRAEVARSLILDQLKLLRANGTLKR